MRYRLSRVLGSACSGGVLPRRGKKRNNLSLYGNKLIMYFVFENTNTSILFSNTLLAMYLYLYFKYKFRKYLYFVFKYFLKVFDRTLAVSQKEVAHFKQL